MGIENDRRGEGRGCLSSRPKKSRETAECVFSLNGPNFCAQNLPQWVMIGSDPVCDPVIPSPQDHFRALRVEFTPISFYFSVSSTYNSPRSRKSRWL